MRTHIRTAIATGIISIRTLQTEILTGAIGSCYFGTHDIGISSVIDIANGIAGLCPPISNLILNLGILCHGSNIPFSGIEIHGKCDITTCFWLQVFVAHDLKASPPWMKPIGIQFLECRRSETCRKPSAEGELLHPEHP